MTCNEILRLRSGSQVCDEGEWAGLKPAPTEKGLADGRAWEGWVPAPVPCLHGGKLSTRGQAMREDKGWGLVFEEDGLDVFDVGVGGEAPDADVAAAEVAVGVPVGGDGGSFVVYFFPIAQEL